MATESIRACLEQGTHHAWQRLYGELLDEVERYDLAVLKIADQVKIDKLQNVDEAMRTVLRKALAQDPEADYLHGQLAAAYRGMGDTAKAAAEAALLFTQGM